ncbi:DNA primase [Sinirhodobacter populi]|uniref:DNA primase n=1 Tax=Paenirhodobacter populi TaxID=2306993 RepID=A0A443K0F1_9RHOB|nr:toprim domain-containing protein [Sinirhodobacter populi]RWR09190.1 DNA primase [Sinirhodobacter populi]RWR26214.1 DNA primase [Sinirhodobacter populi]
MSRLFASELATRLGRQAEAVCRHYLPAGRKTGSYWIVGDVHNSPGRSMFVRLTGPVSGKGAAGRWQDANSGEYGDLLDIIRTRCGLHEFRDVADEAIRFLGMPHPELTRASSASSRDRDASEFGDAARRLFRMSQTLGGTLAETYLRSRALIRLGDLPALRFHPRCFYRPEDGGPTEQWPALIAAITDLKGRQTGSHRTWLARDGSGKAPLDPPRRAMGDLLGHGVRFGVSRDVLAAGEGIESVLSVRDVLPGLPMLAALSAGHLGAVLFPDGLQRLYILGDRDTAGEGAVDRLAARAFEAGIDPVPLLPNLGDFNDDLRLLGHDALRLSLQDQLIPGDFRRFALA